MTTTDKPAVSTADKLRAAAEWLDRHAAVIGQPTTIYPVGVLVNDPTEFRILAATLPGVVTFEANDSAYYARSIDSIVYLFGPVSALCDRREVDVELVPKYDYVLKGSTS